MKPKIISICGIDGSGKSTQALLLANTLRNKGFRVKICKVELIGSEVLFRLSEKLFGDRYSYHPGIPPDIMNTILATDFTRYYTNILNLYDDCDFLICDRYKICYLAYPMAYNSNMKWINKIVDLIPDPDLCFYLNITVDQAVSRLKMRLNEPIRADENYELLVDVVNMYKKLTNSMNDIIIINADNPPEIVHEEICKFLL